jgi:hypothetical protein
MSSMRSLSRVLKKNQDAIRALRSGPVWFFAQIGMDRDWDRFASFAETPKTGTGTGGLVLAVLRA